MSIITISRGSYSRGKSVAEKLAEKLSYECLSREILLEASDEFNIPEIKLIRALHDAPTILDRFNHGKERYVAYIRSALLKHALKDNMVYHGLAGHYLLKDVSHVLKVRILSNMDERVKEEMHRENISAEEAFNILKKDDEERRKWGINVYGVDTNDSSLYDIVLHIDTITIDDAVETLYSLVQRKTFAATPESLKKIRDMALEAKVKADLIEYIPSLNVTADDGVVSISNIEKKRAVEVNTIETLYDMTEKIEGVKEVHIHLTSVKKKPDHINPFYNM